MHETCICICGILVPLSVPLYLQGRYPANRYPANSVRSEITDTWCIKDTSAPTGPPAPGLEPKIYYGSNLDCKMLSNDR